MKQLVENLVDSVVEHYGEGSFVNYHVEVSIVNHDDGGSIVALSGDASNDVDHNYEDAKSVCHHFEISNDVNRHTETLTENDMNINENCPRRCADITILLAEMGDGDSSTSYHHSLFSDIANDFCSFW